MDFTPFKTDAAAVRTGMVIQSAWSRAWTSLEVETVTHERFTSPEGVTAHVVRFTGWELFNGEPTFNGDGERTHRVIRGWGQRAHSGDVRVLADRRPDLFNRHKVSPTFGALSGRDDADQLKAELDEFLANLPAAA